MDAFHQDGPQQSCSAVSSVKGADYSLLARSYQMCLIHTLRHPVHPPQSWVDPSKLHPRSAVVCGAQVLASFDFLFLQVGAEGGAAGSPFSKAAGCSAGIQPY